MNVLVYGGAFDPLHNGHVDIMFICVALVDMIGYVWFQRGCRCIKSTQFSGTHRFATCLCLGMIRSLMY